MAEFSLGGVAELSCSLDETAGGVDFFAELVCRQIGHFAAYGGDLVVQGRNLEPPGLSSSIKPPTSAPSLQPDGNPTCNDSREARQQRQIVTAFRGGT
jgi:hypothetical protein